MSASGRDHDPPPQPRGDRPRSAVPPSSSPPPAGPPPPASSGRAPSPNGDPPGRMALCWSEDVALEELLAAAGRLIRSRGRGACPPGENRIRSPAGKRQADPSGRGTPEEAPDPASLPAKRRSLGPSQTKHRSPALGPQPRTAPRHPPGPATGADCRSAGDLFAEDELRRRRVGRGRSHRHQRDGRTHADSPGPTLAAWLAQSDPASLDDAALVTSITGWRKVTSWAQAHELAAVAELARRRGVTDPPGIKRDPARALEADFAPNELALALTLTQCASEYWMSLAASMACQPARDAGGVARRDDRPEPGQHHRPVHDAPRR